MSSRDTKRAHLASPEADVGRFGNSHYRYTILFAAIILTITTIPLWISFIYPDGAPFIIAGFLILFSSIWLSIAFNAWNNFNLLGIAPVPPLPHGVSIDRKRTFTHVVIVPCYLDPIDVLFDCLGSLLLQDNIDSLLVVVAFEKRTPDLENKIYTIETAFNGKFKDLVISVHVLDPRTEIAGGCSNKNYALRKAHQYLIDNSTRYDLSNPFHAVTITTCDTDSLFNPNYFSVLEKCYNSVNTKEYKEPKMCVWQSPLFYNWNLDQRPFFNRTTGIMRSLMMLGGLISFNLNPMSIFSYPLELGLKAGFINPRYGVDDIIAKVRWMCTSNENVPVLLLPIPSISGPTIGISFYDEYNEWARQIRRWIVGSSESFHYFIIHFKGYPLIPGLVWFFMFFMYYAVLLCSAGIFTLLASLPIFATNDRFYSIHGVDLSLSYVSYAALVIQYLVFGVAFIIDRRAIALMSVKENISIVRNLAHWLLSPITLLVYSMIAFYAIIVFIYNGKKFARHDMAAKDGLFANTKANAVVSEPTNAIVIEGGNLEEGGDLNTALITSNASSSTSLSHGYSPLQSTDHLLEMAREGTIVDDDYEQGARSNSRQSSVSQRDSSSAMPADLSRHSQSLSVGPSGRVLLCTLPDQFYFGSYSCSVKEIMLKKRRRQEH